MNSVPDVRLILFGSPSIERGDDRPLAGPAAQRHRLALLALLALAPRRALPREKLMAYLWPERDEEHARQLLNQAVYRLRKALGEAALASGPDDLTLSPAVVGSDVAEFESAVEHGHHAVAAALYQGPFLDGFFLDGAPDFQQWVDQERDRLAGRYSVALEALAEAAEGQRVFGTAVTWWKARAAQDPFDSRVAMRLMQALDAAGNRAAALQHGASHQRLLQEEFGAEPEPSLREMAERLRSQPASRVLEPLAEARLGAPTDVLEPGAATGPRPDSSPPAGPSRPPPAPPQGAWSRRSPVLAVILLGGLLFAASRLWPGGPEASRTGGSEPSIAVLPVLSLGGEAEGDLLAEGMTDALITMLAKTAGLRIIASTSVAGFRDRSLDARRIADSLQVTNVLESGLQVVGPRLRMTVRLVDGVDGSTRWSESYDRELRDLFAMQDDIARSVARELGLRLGAAGDRRGERQPTQSIAAYELYLRGSDRTLLRSDSAAREALGYFRQAIALDSGYAAAWAGLGRMLGRVGRDVASPGRRRYYALGEEAARRALALDDSLAEAHATLGGMRMTAFDFASAERHLKESLLLDPSRALTHEMLVTLYIWTGQPAAALTHGEQSLALDPLSPYANAELARALAANGRCEEALPRIEALLELRPPLLRAAGLAADCYAMKQQWREAIALLRLEAERAGSTGLARLGFMLARSGQREEALAIRSALLERWQRGGGAYEVALLHAGLGDFDQAFDWLDRSLDDGSLIGAPGDPAHLMIVGPFLEELRLHPRFESLRERLGLAKL